MKIVFAGTPAVAIPSLAHLIGRGHDVCLAVTRPDAKVGRKQIVTPSPIAHYAQSHGIEVLRTSRILPADQLVIEATRPELGVAVAFGSIFDQGTLGLPSRGWVNLHFSLLPRWRGAAPVQRALLADEARHGVSVFQIQSGMDDGPIWLQREFPVEPTATAGEVLESFARLGAAVLGEAIDLIGSGAQPSPQIGVPSLAPKLQPDEAILRPLDSVRSNFQRFRAVNPEPGARVSFGLTDLKLHGAAPVPESLLEPQVALSRPGEILAVSDRVFWRCSPGAIELIEVQPAGRTPMPAAAWWRGIR